jgi:4-amino-4-deoxy-L-arabinose transferase-like glycosyltransferase
MQRHAHAPSALDTDSGHRPIALEERSTMLGGMEAGTIRTLFLILALSGIVRIALVYAVSDVGLNIEDERHYVELASNLHTGRGFAWTALGLTSIRPPLYPWFVSLIWTITGTTALQPIRMAQIFLSLATIALVFGIGRHLYGEKIGLVAAAIWGFYPSFLYAGVLLLTEVLFTLLLLSGVAFAVWTLQRPAWWKAFLTGACIGAAALTRSVLWPFPLVLAFVTAFAFRRTPRTAVVLALALVAGHLAIVGPWAVRNSRLQGTMTVIDTMGGLNLRMGNFEYTIEDRMWDGVSLKGDKAWAHEMYRQHPDATTWSEGRKEKWAQQQAITYMRALSNRLYAPPQWFAAVSSALVLASYPLVAILAWVGIVGNRPVNLRSHALVLLVGGFICALHTVVFGHSRYHLPLIPLVCIYAAAALSARPWLNPSAESLSCSASGRTRSFSGMRNGSRDCSSCYEERQTLRADHIFRRPADPGSALRSRRHNVPSGPDASRDGPRTG